MDLGFKLVQEQQLKLIMTPQLRQAITILQYSAVDLVQYVREQAEQNPLIDLEEPELIKAESLPFKSEPSLPWEETEHHSFAEWRSAAEDYVPPIDYVAKTEGGLAQALKEQLAYMDLPENMLNMVHYLIGNLDEQGYLQVGYDQASSDLNCSAAEWEEAVQTLQQLEPYGVGARDIHECLYLQWKHEIGPDEAARRLIEEHLPDLASKRYDRIAASLGQTVEDIQDMADIIRGFHPKPGILEQNHAPKYIIPDVYVDRVAPGKYVVQVNDGVLPHVRFNEDYENLVQDHGEASKYIQDRLQQYRWLIRSIDQRKETLLRVTEAIIERQLEFFEQEHGERQPLSLKEIAAELDIHESTVSRAINHKYVQTPRGVFELKYFFAKRVPLANGAYTSDAQVKRIIRDLIEQEDKKKPLSDQKIADQISMRGIQLARRTVSKYREQMGVLSSSRRKQAH